MRNRHSIAGEPKNKVHFLHNDISNFDGIALAHPDILEGQTSYSFVMLQEMMSCFLWHFRPK